jgi:hypothetical protein
MAAPAHEHILVVVHPGSACGSANENLGRAKADEYRDELTFLFEQWEGPVLVIDGALSDELPYYGPYGRALNDLVARAQAQGKLGLRVQGDDAELEHNQEWAIAEQVRLQGWTPATHRFTVTGAWFEVPTGDGCVGSVIQALRAQQFQAYVSPHVVAITRRGYAASEAAILKHVDPAYFSAPEPDSTRPVATLEPPPAPAIAGPRRRSPSYRK